MLWLKRAARPCSLQAKIHFGIPKKIYQEAGCFGKHSTIVDFWVCTAKNELCEKKKKKVLELTVCRVCPKRNTIVQQNSKCKEEFVCCRYFQSA